MVENPLTSISKYYKMYILHRNFAKNVCTHYTYICMYIKYIYSYNWQLCVQFVGKHILTY